MPTVPFPGTKFPSHVFQLAKGLQGQLDELYGLARENPDWLSQQEGAAISCKDKESRTGV